MQHVKDYVDLPYTKIVKWEPEDELFVAWIKEVPGCTAHGGTEAAALEMLRDNFEDWLAFSIEEGDRIPLPEDCDDLPSGKWLQRVPRSLHKLLIQRAEAEGVSLNSYVSTTLALAVGSETKSQKQSTAHSVIESLQAAGYQKRVSLPNLAVVNVERAYSNLISSGVAAFTGSPSIALRPRANSEISSLKQKSKTYSMFVDSLVGHLPNSTNLLKRIPRDKEEEYKDQAYAFA